MWFGKGQEQANERIAFDQLSEIGSLTARVTGGKFQEGYDTTLWPVGVVWGSPTSAGFPSHNATPLNWLHDDFAA